MKKKMKRLLYMVLAAFVLICNITFTYFNTKTYAAIDPVSLVVYEEIVKAVVGSLAGASVRTDIEEDKQLQLFNKNKASYYETIKYIVENPSTIDDLILEDQKENFISALQAYKNNESSIEEYKRYVNGSLAVAIPQLANQYRMIINNPDPEDPEDDPDEKKVAKAFKLTLLKRAAALGGAIGFAASNMLLILYGIDINNEELKCTGETTDATFSGRWTTINPASIYDGYYWIIDNYVSESNGKKTAAYEETTGYYHVYTYDIDKPNTSSSKLIFSGAEFPYYSPEGVYKGNVYLGRSSSKKVWGYYNNDAIQMTSNVPTFNTYEEMMEYFKGNLNVENAINYDKFDEESFSEDHLQDLDEIEKQQALDNYMLKMLIDLQPNAKDQVRGFIGIYEDTVADLSKQGVYPQTDDIEQAAKRQVEKRIDPEYVPDPDIHPEIDPQPFPDPTPVPDPSVNPEPTTAPEPNPTTAPEPNPEPDPVPDPGTNPDPSTDFEFDYSGLLALIIELLRQILEAVKKILDCIIIDVPQIEAALSKLKAPPITGHPMLVLLGKFQNLTITYPKLVIDTPTIIGKFYDEPQIILVDFLIYKKYCVWARRLCQFGVVFTFGWAIIRRFRVGIQIS